MVHSLEIQSYALLADVGLSCQAEIEEHLQHSVSHFVVATSMCAQIPGPDLVERCTLLAKEMRVDNFGHVGTRMLFNAIGIQEIPRDLCCRAAELFHDDTMPEQSSATDGPTPFKIFAYAEYELVKPRVLKGRLRCENGFRTGAGRPRWLLPTQLPISGFVDRELCAEFQALEATCDVLVGMLRGGSASMRAEVCGNFNLLVSGACCISCVCAVRQFQLLWPGVSVKVGTVPHASMLSVDPEM